MLPMYKQWCANGTLDDSKYTSPMPMIGFYIAISSLACFLAILCDVLCAFRSRKPWLLVNSSHSSLTLTLISVSTKLPVGLTTKMPSSQDQLSKLTGTVFICICMGYFMPSLGPMRKPEARSNMAALTILVTTVAVNICIQIQTGVIFSFITEHIVVMFCMLVLLGLLWYSMLIIDNRKSFCMDRHGKLLIGGITTTNNTSSQSMKQRFRECYVQSYGSNPQLVILQTSHSAIIGVVCLLCTCLISKALFKSLLVKEEDSMFLFCEGDSDYGKVCVWMVVVIQILNVLSVTILANFRWLKLAFQLSLFDENLHHDNEDFLEFYKIFIRTYWYWVYESEFSFVNLRFRFPSTIFKKVFWVFQYLSQMALACIKKGLLLTEMLILLPFLTMKALLEFCVVAIKSKGAYIDTDHCFDSSSSEEFQDMVFSVQAGLQRWIVRKGVEDLDRWITFNKRNPPNHLNHLLLQTHPSLQGLLTKDIQVIGTRYEGYGYHIGKDASNFLQVSYKYRVSCLSMVTLILIAAVSLPSALGDLLIHALDEIFETVYFIDQKMNAARKIKGFAGRLNQCGSIGKKIFFLWKKKFFKHGKADQLDLDGSLMFIERLKRLKNWSFAASELQIMGDFIQSREYASIEELGNHIKQTFVDMLHYFLPMFPQAIFKDVGESPVEECEERVKVAMKLLCKFELIEDKFEWVFPAENNITRLITNQLSTEDSKSTTQVEGSVEVFNATTTTTDHTQVECSVRVTTSSPITDPLDGTTQVEGSVVVSIIEHPNSTAQAEDDVVVSTSAEELRNVVYSVQEDLQRWIVRRGVEDLERWIALNKRNPPNHLNHLLLQTHPSLQGLLTKDIQVTGKNLGNLIGKDAFYTLNVGYKYRVSCLSVVILVLIGAVSLPSSMGDLLINALDEIFEILYFIDQKMNVAARYNNKMICSQAKTLWINRKETIFLLKMKFFESGQADQLDLDGSLRFIEKLKRINDRSFTLSELRVMGHFIQSKEYASIEELSNHIKQIFVDMLHYFLPMLPQAIFKDVGESPVEECEERVRVAMKLLCKFELMEDKFQWVFPAENNITCLITSQLPNEANPSKSTTQVEVSVQVPHATMTTIANIDSNTQVQGSVVVSITENPNSNAQPEDAVVVSTSAAGHLDSITQVEDMVLVPMNTKDIGYVSEIQELGP